MHAIIDWILLTIGAANFVLGLFRCERTTVLKQPNYGPSDALLGMFLACLALISIVRGW